MSKRPADNDVSTSKRPKNYSSMNASEKLMAAKLWEKCTEHDIKKAKLLSLFEAAGYKCSPATLARHVRNLAVGEPILSPNKSSGAQDAISEYQMQILIGHIFGKIQSEEIVTRATGVAFLAEQGWPTVTEHTMGNYYARHHIVQRTGKKKNAGYKIDLSAMPQDYMDYLKECRLQGWIRDIFCTIDFTYTSHRYSHKTFGIKARPQPKIKVSLPPYTNCIVTLLCSDGSQVPSMLFTHNPAFRLDRRPTAKVQKEEVHLKKMMREFGIDSQRICFVSPGNGKNTKYCRESPLIVNTFMEHNHAELNRFTHIFSDDGNAFFNQGADIINDLGYERHVFIPHCHALMSPNDNKFHGHVKQQWRKSGVDFNDDPKACLMLMSLMDNTPAAAIKSWFVKNFFFDTPRLDITDVQKFCFGGKVVLDDYYQECHALYRQEVLGEVSEEVSGAKRVECALDGGYWAE